MPNIFLLTALRDPSVFMSNDHASPVKDKLLQLSEEIVDLSDRMDAAETENDDHEMHSSMQRLRRIGDVLVDYQEQTSGDDLAFTRFMMGSVCSLLGYWNQAEQSYREALSQWPDHIGILNELFDALVAQRKYEQAEKVIRSSIETGGETPLILRNYAAVLVHLKRLNKARVVMFNCIAKFPDDQESRIFLNKLETAGRR